MEYISYNTDIYGCNTILQDTIELICPIINNNKKQKFLDKYNEIQNNTKLHEYAHINKNLLIYLLNLVYLSFENNIIEINETDEYKELLNEKNIYNYRNYWRI